MIKKEYNELDKKLLQKKFNLSDNAKTVLEARYLQKDENGNIIESVEEMFLRVADTVASAEKPELHDEYKEIFYNEMIDGNFLPNSPCLMNAGKNNGNSLFACQPYDSLVLTNKGYRKIGDIVRDYNAEDIIVSNGKGKWVKVKYGQSQGIKEVYRVYLNSGRYFDITDNQEIFSAKFENSNKCYSWNELKDLKEKDYVYYGDTVTFEDKEAVNIDLPLVAWLMTDGGVYIYSKRKKEEFVGEIQTINPETTEYVCNLLNKLNFRYTVNYQDKGFTRIRSYDNNLKLFSDKYDLFKRKNNKEISQLVIESNIESKREFLRSIFEADGSVTKYVYLTSVSEKMIIGISKLLDEFGICSYITCFEDKRANRLKRYNLTISHNKDIKRFFSEINFISKIKKEKLEELINKKIFKNRNRTLYISKIDYIGEQEVFDIETDGSYICNGVMLHNCFVLPVEDSIPDIFGAVAKSAYIQKMGGGVGYSFEKIRPKGSLVNTSKGKSSGVMSFMEVFNQAIEAIQQGCFVGSTLISTPKGAIPIKDIKENDIVYGYDIKTNKMVETKVLNSWLSKKDAEVITVEFTRDYDDRILKYTCTPNHQFLDINKNYIEIQNLEIGAEVQVFTAIFDNADGKCKLIKKYSSKNEDVYDIETEIHNFLLANYDDSSIVVHNSFRRGAQMGILPIWHPEIISFIKYKQDLNKLKNFNISISMTDEFMDMLKNTPNEIWKFKFNDKVFDNDCNGDKYTVRQIWDLIIDCAHSTGEPGIVFIDEVNRYNPTPELGRIIASNPCSEQFLHSYQACIAKDELVFTRDGLKKIQDVASCDYVPILKNDKMSYSKVSDVIYNGTREIYKLNTIEGLSLKLTKDHKVLTNCGWKEAQNLNTGDKILIPNDNLFESVNENDELSEMFGWIHGDGWFTNNVGISFTENDQDFRVKDQILKIFDDFFECGHRKPLYNTNKSFQKQTECKIAIKKGLDYGFKQKRAYERELPDYIWNSNATSKRSFLRGLFSADGSVSGNLKNQVYLASTSKKMIEQVQIILNTFGIFSSIYTTTFKNSDRRNQYKLAITKESAYKYMNQIGFVKNSIKNEQFNFRIHKKYKDNYYVRFKSLDYIGNDDVYDLFIPEGNMFVAGGLFVHNCCLGSINLNNFIDKNDINFHKLKLSVQNLVRFLDNIIDINIYPLPEIEKEVKRSRNIGLGIMGWADILYKLNCPYNSERALELADRIMNTVNQTALEYSSSLAIHRGNFELFEKSIYKDKFDMLRNSSVTNIAPTGSISIIDSCSSGIEPLFALAFYRNILGGSKLIEINKIFKEIADKNNCWGIEDLYDKLASGISLQSFKEIPEDIKKVFVTAQDIDPKTHILMQSAFQKHVTNAISKTVNLPNSASKEDVSEAYLFAYRHKCKGVTVYRDGCRFHQPIAFDKKEEIIIEKNVEIKKKPSKLKEILSAVKIKQKTPFGNLHIKIVLNMPEGKEVELFAQLGKGGDLANSDLEAIGRMASLYLRDDTSDVENKIEHVIKNLKGIGSSLSIPTKDGRILSIADALGTGLKKYLLLKKKYGIENLLLGKYDDDIDIKPDVKPKQDNYKIKCPDCDAYLTEEEGCIKCYSCGYSKC